VMMMFETTEAGFARKPSFRETFAALPGTIESKLPTMDRSLDRYFDAHMAAIISEWGLVTTHTLDNLDDRLEAVTAEIRSLEKGRDEIGKRVAALEAGIRELEA